MALAEITDRASLQALVRREIETAESWIDDEIGPDRAEALKYYRGEKFGNEEDGRSQVVWRVVRDSVRQILPSLIRVFFGSEKAVEYAPRGPEDAASAEQATDYANYVILQDNPGVKVFYDAFCDSLYQKVGVVKLWRDESVEVSYHEFTELDDAGVGLVLSEPGTEPVNVSSRVADPDSAGQFLMLGIDPPLIHDVTVKRTRKAPRIRLAAVPPEEFLIAPHARSIEDASYVGHKMYKTVGELVALGYDRELIEDNIHAGDEWMDSPAAFERHKPFSSIRGDTKNPDAKRVLYVESWIRVDLDGEMDADGFPQGDGLAELRKFCTIGEGYEIVNGDGLGEPASEIPFAAFCPYPEPHLFFGEDVADQTKDLQLVMSNLIRTSLDSLSLSLYPRAGVVEGMVTMADVLNTEMGAPIRMQAPGMYQPFTHAPVAKEALPFVEMVKAEGDRRVGVHNMALEADALQSTTKAAVNAQVDAARQQIELIARLYAEIGMKRVFTLLLKLIVSHQDKPRTVRLRNQWVEVDPSTWNANMDVIVNVGLGHGMTEDRIQALANGMATQLKFIELLGPHNPFVTPTHLAQSAAKMYELAGFKDTSQFIDKDAQLPPPQPPPPSDAQILADIEKLKTRERALEAAAKIEQDRDKMLADIHLEAAKIAGQYGTKVDVDAIARSLEQNRLTRQTLDEGEPVEVAE